VLVDPLFIIATCRRSVGDRTPPYRMEPPARRSPDFPAT